jgi:Ca2+:H+ antiporter
LFSHKALYEDDNEDVLVSKGYARGENPWLRLRPRRAGPTVASPTPMVDEEMSRSRNAEGTDAEHSTSTDPGTEVEPYMSVTVCLGLLVGVTVVSATAPY